jgi:hypothetical protein
MENLRQVNKLNLWMEDDFMKKLLALVLVLCLASLANATVTISISGDSTISTGETKSYTVSWSGTPDIVSVDMDCVSDDADKGTCDNFVIVADYRDTAIDYIGDPLGGGSGAEVSCTNDTTSDPLGGALFTFDLTATGSLHDVINLTLTDWYTQDVDWTQVIPDMSGMGVEIIPEPITLALLGLGALFIRRR